MKKTKYCTAIVLAAGQGKRMGTSVQKQYIQLEGKPVLFYCLDVFQKSEIIDEIILVVGEGQQEYCQKEICQKYGIQKITQIVTGGKERYHSVYRALQHVKESDYVFIHDGARPFVTEKMIKDSYHEVQQYLACVVGMPVKDTIKIADEEGFADYTPKRESVWMVQTPQVFETNLISEAYMHLMENENPGITDDAMVVETIMNRKVKLVEGSYKNIKITTPEDLLIAKEFIEEKH